MVILRGGGGRGGWVPKVKPFKGKYETKLGFAGGWVGIQTKEPSLGEI